MTQGIKSCILLCIYVSMIVRSVAQCVIFMKENLPYLKRTNKFVWLHSQCIVRGEGCIDKAWTFSASVCRIVLQLVVTGLGWNPLLLLRQTKGKIQLAHIAQMKWNAWSCKTSSGGETVLIQLFDTLTAGLIQCFFFLTCMIMNRYTFICQST